MKATGVHAPSPPIQPARFATSSPKRLPSSTSAEIASAAATQRNQLRIRSGLTDHRAWRHGAGSPTRLSFPAAAGALLAVPPLLAVGVGWAVQRVDATAV